MHTLWYKSIFDYELTKLSPNFPFPRPLTINKSFISIFKSSKHL